MDSLKCIFDSFLKVENIARLGHRFSKDVDGCWKRELAVGYGSKCILKLSRFHTKDDGAKEFLLEFKVERDGLPRGDNNLDKYISDVSFPITKEEAKKVEEFMLKYTVLIGDDVIVGAQLE